MRTIKNKAAEVSPRSPRALSASKKVNLAKPMKKGGTKKRLAKAQDGTEVDSMMINKPGYGAKKSSIKPWANKLANLASTVSTYDPRANIRIANEEMNKQPQKKKGGITKTKSNGKVTSMAKKRR
jgi:hypothetical protein